MLNENIKALRKQKGYSQETLAQELNVVRQTVSKWEKGYSVPDAIMLERMAELFDVQVGDLLGGEGKNVDYKTELEQLTAQLSILNDQYAREMARQQRIRDIKKKLLIPVLAAFLVSFGGLFASVCVSCPRYEAAGYGDISLVKTHDVPSELFTQEDISGAADTVKVYFFEEFGGCVLNELYYAGDEESRMEAEDYEGAQVLVLTSSFYVEPDGGDGSLNTDYTYSGWKWMLSREPGGEWDISNYGLG